VTAAGRPDTLSAVRETARSRARRIAARAQAAPSRQDMLGIYLNDHLAGATAGVELARRLARAQRDSGTRGTLQRLAADIAQDRKVLLAMMATLGVPVRSYKIWAGWLVEKAGRLKLNGQLRSRSPLSDLLELEMMRLGVEGKAAGWRTLRELAQSSDRLRTVAMDELLARARSQSDVLEELRLRTAALVIGTAG
jgi:hypothetical protein